MYWYKYNPFLFVATCMVFMAACKPEVKENGGPKYFDLKGYFKAEAARLSKQKTFIVKTINYNNEPEKKSVVIKNWQRELSLFIESDINKPSWKDSYKVNAKSDSITYTAVDTTLRTRNIIIVQKGDRVKSVEINNFTKNLLYQTRDHLSYYPDSVYQIEKHQAVKILGANNYQITGRFK